MLDRMPPRLTRPCLRRAVLGSVLALVFPQLAPAHGDRGMRNVAVFDLSAGPNVSQAVARAASDAIQGAFAAGAGSVPNECITLTPQRMRLLSTLPLFPIPRDFGARLFDYALWGEVTGTAGAYHLSLWFTTASTRIPVASASGAFERASDAASAGSVAASKILMTGGHIREAVRVFERDRRARNTGYAMGPTLSLTPANTTLEVNQSAAFSITLKDCDGSPLDQRAVEPRVGEDGRASPLQLQTDGNGSGRFTFFAPGKSGLTHVDAFFSYFRPSDRLGEGLREVAGIKVVRPSAYEPAVWDASVTMSRVYDGRVRDWESAPAPFGASSRVTESFDPVRVEFKVNRLRHAIPGEISSYNWKYEMVTTRSGSPFVSQKGAETGTKLGFDDNGTWVNGWDFTIKRNLRPAEGVPELNVYDEDGPAADLFAQIAARREELLPGEKASNECVLTAKATFPGKATTVNGLTGEAETADSRPTIEESVAGEAYHHDQPRHSRQVPLPLAQAGADFGISKRTFQYDLTFLPKFDFESSDFAVRIDGEDFTEKFKVRMFWREWMSTEIANDLDVTRLGAYKLVSDWETGDDPTSSPIVRAQRLSKERADNPNLVWPRMRRLREYLVQVEEFPEMGFFYYVITWDTAPPQIFRVYRYRPFRITASEWRKAKFSKEPFRTEENAGPVINNFR